MTHNTGAASIFVMLEECWRTGRFRPGDRVTVSLPQALGLLEGQPGRPSHRVPAGTRKRFPPLHARQ
jgi:hypothetical protein